jgi:hypothetical protein
MARSIDNSVASKPHLLAAMTINTCPSQLMLSRRRRAMGALLRTRHRVQENSAGERQPEPLPDGPAQRGVCRNQRQPEFVLERA